MSCGFFCYWIFVNSFSHAFRFLDNRNPYFAIGCAIPDWLGAVDRRCRVRKKGATPKLNDPDPLVANLAAGIIQHIEDDRWFHGSRAFSELNLVFAVELRELLKDEPGFRPMFLGHIIIELLLDGYLHQSFPGKLDLFYEMVEKSDPAAIEAAVCSMATKPTDKLSQYFPIFLRERYLFDYVDDDRLIYRINHVLRCVKLSAAGDELSQWVPLCRSRVYERALELLEPLELENTGLQKNPVE